MKIVIPTRVVVISSLVVYLAGALLTWNYIKIHRIPAWREEAKPTEVRHHPREMDHQFVRTLSAAFWPIYWANWVAESAVVSLLGEPGEEA